MDPKRSSGRTKVNDMTTNPNGKIYLALTTHLENMTGAPAIAFQGDDFTPNAGSPYLISNDVRLDQPRAYMATSDPDNRKGMYMVDAMVPLNWTHPQLMGLVGQVVARFSKDRTLTYDDVSLQITDTPQPQGAAYRDGNYNRQPIKIEWQSWG